MQDGTLPRSPLVPALGVFVTLLATTEFVFNSAREQVSHLVVELTYSDFGNTVTVCGIEASGADLFPNYNLCLVCTGKASDG
jgi:hypothetical protein